MGRFFLLSIKYFILFFVFTLIYNPVYSACTPDDIQNQKRLAECHIINGEFKLAFDIIMADYSGKQKINQYDRYYLFMKILTYSDNTSIIRQNYPKYKKVMLNSHGFCNLALSTAKYDVSLFIKMLKDKHCVYSSEKIDGVIHSITDETIEDFSLLIAKTNDERLFILSKYYRLRFDYKKAADYLNKVDNTNTFEYQKERFLIDSSMKKNLDGIISRLHSFGKKGYKFLHEYYVEHHRYKEAESIAKEGITKNFDLYTEYIDVLILNDQKHQALAELWDFFFSEKISQNRFVSLKKKIVPDDSKTGDLLIEKKVLEKVYKKYFNKKESKSSVKKFFIYQYLAFLIQSRQWSKYKKVIHETKPDQSTVYLLDSKMGADSYRYMNHLWFDLYRRNMDAFSATRFLLFLSKNNRMVEFEYFYLLYENKIRYDQFLKYQRAIFLYKLGLLNQSEEIFSLMVNYKKSSYYLNYIHFFLFQQNLMRDSSRLRRTLIKNLNSISEPIYYKALYAAVENQNRQAENYLSLYLKNPGENGDDAVTLLFYLKLFINRKDFRNLLMAYLDYSQSQCLKRSDHRINPLNDEDSFSLVVAYYTALCAKKKKAISNSDFIQLLKKIKKNKNLRFLHSEVDQYLHR